MFHLIPKKSWHVSNVNWVQHGLHKKWKKFGCKLWFSYGWITSFDYFLTLKRLTCLIGLSTLKFNSIDIWIMFNKFFLLKSSKLIDIRYKIKSSDLVLRFLFDFVFNMFMFFKKCQRGPLCIKFFKDLSNTFHKHETNQLYQLTSYWVIGFTC